MSGRHQRDADVRPALVAWAQQRAPRARVLPELGLLHGDVRVDVAALSPRCLHGYELKADADTLRRLPRQVDAYSQVMDLCTLVAGPRHMDAARQLVPAWWGLVLAGPGPEGVLLVEVREAAPNAVASPLATAQLLWRDEALALLREAGAARGLSRRPRLVLYQQLVEVLPAPVLRTRVRRTLLARGDWRERLR